MAKKPKIVWYGREWRKHFGYTLEKAAGLAHMQIGYLSELEKGKKRVNTDHLVALANAYGMDDWRDLLWNPAIGRPLIALIHSMKESDREMAARLLETLTKKTGT